MRVSNVRCKDANNWLMYPACTIYFLARIVLSVTDKAISESPWPYLLICLFSSFIKPGHVWRKYTIRAWGVAWCARCRVTQRTGCRRLETWVIFGTGIIILPLSGENERSLVTRPRSGVFRHSIFHFVRSQLLDWNLQATSHGVTISFSGPKCPPSFPRFCADCRKLVLCRFVVSWLLRKRRAWASS